MTVYSSDCLVSAFTSAFCLGKRKEGPLLIRSATGTSSFRAHVDSQLPGFHRLSIENDPMEGMSINDFIRQLCRIF